MSKIAHVLLGSGEHRVICLHGWFGSADAWGPFTQHLDGSAFTYAFMDYRGFGARKSEGGPFTNKQIAADAIALADELGWKEFSVVGHSMGGKAMQRVLADAPGRVKKLAGISPVPAGVVPFDDQGWALFDSAAEKPESRYGIIDFTTGNRLTKTWIDDMVAHSLATSTKEAFAASLLTWAKEDFVADIQGKPVPVLALAGANDPALSVDVMKGTFGNWYPNAKIEVIPNAGHYAMFETPIALATTIESFLKA